MGPDQVRKQLCAGHPGTGGHSGGWVTAAPESGYVQGPWHWVVTVVGGSGKVKTGSFWHPAVTQDRTGEESNLGEATGVPMEATPTPHLPGPIAKALGPSNESCPWSTGRFTV